MHIYLYCIYVYCAELLHFCALHLELRSTADRATMRRRLRWRWAMGTAYR